jgi:hypothetical protein
MSIPATQFVPPPVARWRWISALVVAVLGALALAVTVLGTWNPWSLVVLHRLAADPARDLFVTLALAAVAFWLGAPVTSEANQNRRLSLRIWLIGLAALVGLGALGSWGLAIFRYEPQVIARSADGRHEVALVTVLHGREVHAFAGTGIGARDQGSFGRPCGGTVTARFTGPDEVLLSTDYGDLHLHLDPATGRPVGHLGPTCSG